MKPHPLHRLTGALVIGTLCLALPVAAQQSVNKELDTCIDKERMKLTMKGAAAGALAGLGASLLGKKGDDNKKDDALKGAAIGAVLGGAGGFAMAHFTAMERCTKKNPSWIPESKIERTKSYEQARAESGYRPEAGLLVKVKSVDMPVTVGAGSTLDIRSKFVVLTPDGAEAPVEIERKLFEVANGKETQVPFAGRPKEHRTVEPGEHVDVVQVPIPANFAPGTAFRVEFSVAADKTPASIVSSTVTVQKSSTVAAAHIPQ